MVSPSDGGTIHSTSPQFKNRGSGGRGVHKENSHVLHKEKTNRETNQDHKLWGNMDYWGERAVLVIHNL